MANDTQITVVGNLTADPDLRYTQSGHAVANGTIASTPRKFNRQTNEWEDQEALFLRFSAWRDLGEHVAASLSKGMRVIAQGNLTQRSYEDKEGNTRTSVELDVTEIGPSLAFATAQVTRATKGGGQGAPQGQQAPVQQPQGYGPPQGQQVPQQGYPGVPQQAPQQPQMPQQAPQYPGVPQQAPQQAPQAPQMPQQAPQQWSQPGQGFDQAPF